jgi:hypothetical protein
MSIADIDAFVAEWCDAWNAHDVEAVLEHFHDDAVFASPFGKMVIQGSDGIFRGKEAICQYWQTALAMVPDLHFEVVRHCIGVDALVIEYRNQRGIVVDEVLIFDGDRVRRGFGTYPPEALVRR